MYDKYIYKVFEFFLISDIVLSLVVFI